MKKSESLRAFDRLRKVWGFNPDTRIKESKKKYKRQAEKNELKKILKGEDNG